MANGTVWFPPERSAVEMLPSELVREIEEVRGEGHAVDLVEAEGWANAVFSAYRVPPGFNKTATALLVKFPMSYPNGRPAMFWTDESLLLKDGRPPQSAELIESALGSRWRRFSWHPQSSNPAINSVRTYLEFINARLDKAV